MVHRFFRCLFWILLFILFFLFAVLFLCFSFSFSLQTIALCGDVYWAFEPLDSEMRGGNISEINRVWYVTASIRVPICVFFYRIMVHFFFTLSLFFGPSWWFVVVGVAVVIIAGGCDVVVCLFDDYSVNNACDLTCTLYAVILFHSMTVNSVDGKCVCVRLCVKQPHRKNRTDVNVILLCVCVLLHVFCLSFNHQIKSFCTPNNVHGAARRACYTSIQWLILSQKAGRPTASAYSEKRVNRTCIPRPYFTLY